MSDVQPIAPIRIRSRLAHALRSMRRWSRLFWGTILLGLLLNIAATLLVTPLHAQSLNDTVLELIFLHPLVSIPVGVVVIVLTMAIELAGVDAVQPAPAIDDDRDRQNRERLLDKLDYYYENALKQYLLDAPKLRLSLVTDPDLVRDLSHRAFRPQPILQRPPHSTRSIVVAFDHAKGELLIAGEPGAGKTTLLLELARELVGRARAGQHQLPVVLNLSSWTNDRAPLADWLVEALRLVYQVPRDLGKMWLAADRLLPMLDGLDEVPAAHRRACVEAINAFRRSHPHPLVACSRTGAYPWEGALLDLHSAVVVQPLTADQVKRQLARAGESKASLRADLARNPALLELLTTPLMLSIVTVTYRRRLGRDLATMTEDEIHSYMLSRYITRMLERKVLGVGQDYHTQRIRRWLVWLAQQLKAHNQTEFYLEQLQVDWLPPSPWNRLVIGGVAGAVVAFFGWLGYTLFYMQHFGTIGGVANGLLVACVCIFIYVIVNGWLLDRWDSLREGSGGQWQRRAMMVLTSRLAYGLLFGIPIGSLVGVRMGLSFGLAAGVAYTIYNVISLTSYFVLYGRLERDVRPAEVVRWSWTAALQAAIRFTPAALGGGLGIGLIWTDQLGRVGAIRLGLLLGIMGAIVVGLSLGFLHDKIDLRWLKAPNQGMRRSLRNSLLLGSLGGAIACLLYGFAFSLTVGPGTAVIWATIGGVTTGQILGLRGGGFACLQHVALRMLLWRAGCIAWDLPRFLNHATDLGLLHRVGGGYAFRHRMLLDHLASTQ